MSLPGVGALRQLGALIQVDQRGQFFGEAFVEQACDRHAHVRGLGDVRVAHAEREPRGLEHQMEALGAGRVELRQIEILEDVEHAPAR